MFLSPIGNSQTVDINGKPVSGGFIETYLAGTSTPATTYTSEDGSTPHGPVITLNSLGWPTLGPVWIAPGAALKFVFRGPNVAPGVPGAVFRTIDNVVGIGDVSFVSSEWQLYAGDPTYISASSFSVLGDQRETFQVNRRMYSQNTGGTVYSTIMASVFGSGITTVTLSNDSGTLDSGLSAVYYSQLAAQNPSIPEIYARLNSAALKTNIIAVGDYSSGLTGVVADTALGAADIGGTRFFASGTPGNVGLPLANASVSGGRIAIGNNGTATLTILPQGGNPIYGGGVAGVRASIPVLAGECFIFETNGATAWLIVASDRV